MLSRKSLGRAPTQIRPVSIETDVNRYAEGSALIKMGHTHILCTASLEETVPNWLSGKNRGWITAEYSMLPRSTHTRTKRDREKTSGRTHEIQRLIARALRGMVNLKTLGERSIFVDCDVLQADGGTRTAAITGGCIALVMALRKISHVWPQCWLDTVAAISVGIKDGEVLVDLDYNEDSQCDVDMNFVATGSGMLIEVQGTAEKKAFSKEDLDRMTASAFSGLEQLKALQVRTLEKIGISR